MKKTIKIGADELILWLRKNDKAIEIPNDEIHGLGQRIYELIVNQLGGKKVIDNHPSYWANLIGDKNIEKYNLPKTSAQYEVEIDKINDVYIELQKW